MSKNKSLVSALQASEENEDVTEDFHEWLREQEADLDESAMLPSQQPTQMRALGSGDGPSVGSSRVFKVLSAFSGGSSYTNVTAKLVYKTDNFLVYIDSRNENSLNASDLENLFQPFNDVVEKERGLFGHESDVDGDGRFNILLTQEVNELGGSAGGIVTGFFYAVDLFSSSTYAQSNQTEIFYTFVPDPSGQFGSPIGKSFALSNILPSVLPHEYQHMINFNMHYFENNGSPEISFLNEAISHLAEDIYSMDSSGYMTTTGIENPARVSGYLASIDDLCIVCGSSLYQRGGGYLLIRYLYEQAEKGNLPGAASGADLLDRLLNTNLTGVANIVKAAYNSNAKESIFRSLMGQFGLAVFLSDTGLSDDNRLNFDGINLRAAQNDNRGTTLRGPMVNALSSSNFTNSIAGASVSFIELTGKSIQSMGGQLGIQLSSSGKAGAFLVQTGL